MEQRARAAREKRLYEASLSGSVESLNELMKEDALSLVRVCLTCFDETPLHIASMLGHLRFATLLLSHKPDLATELDSHGSSPLHLASVNGYGEIVNKLLSVNTDMCLVRDEDGRTPLHLAVMKGRVHVIRELVRTRPEAIQYKLDRGETLLHTCVKHNRLEALKLLLDFEGVHDFINVKDGEGNTILHMATALKQMETIKYLLNGTGVEVNAVNENVFTALDIIEHTPRDLKSMQIHEELRNNGASRARDIPDQVHFTESARKWSVGVEVNRKAQARSPSSGGEPPLKKHGDWLDKKYDSLMVTATVIATMSFQAGLSPPGGGQKEAGGYRLFFLYNTVSFLASLSTLSLLVSGLPLKRRVVMWILMAAMWVTIQFMALTYLVSMMIFTADHHNQESSIYDQIQVSLCTWMGFAAILFLATTVRFLIWCIRKLLKLRRKRLSSNLTESTYGQANA